MGLTTEQKEKRRHDPRVQHIKKCICNKESGKPYVFISYKSDDWEPVLQDVVYKLVKDYGLNIYFDGDFDSNSIGWLEQFRTNMRKYSSDRDTLRVECKSAVFHADFLLLRLSRFGNSTGLDASS